MEEPKTNPEKDVGILGGLFQTVVNDLRGSSPVWEDFTYKSMKLHSSLKTTVVTIGAFLEAFQKVADMATNSKGATREIGSALTRLCMRHRSIESHLKVLTSSILDNLVAPLQEKLEDWKKVVAQLDKDHSKEYKKAKQDIKKAASDTMRLQKKVRKGTSHGKSDMHHKLESAMLEVNSKYHQLEETEKNSVRAALIEERSRFCLFITCLKPFVDNELKLLTEISHIGEIMESLCLQASDPSVLPPSSEQVILDLKGVDGATWSLNQVGAHGLSLEMYTTDDSSSPSSLGSRKSSMCSINSINSSSSGSSHSPSHTMHKRTASQPPPGAIRLTSVSSQDSGFTSQDTLFLCPMTPQSLNLYQASGGLDPEGDGDCDSTPTTPSDNTPSASSTWNNWPNLPGAPKIDPARPHTISSTYEKGHSRPPLKLDMFEPPQEDMEVSSKPSRSTSQKIAGHKRPSATISKLQPVLPPHCPKPKGVAVAPPMLPPVAQPIYANMSELGDAQSELSPDDGEPTTPTTSQTQGENFIKVSSQTQRLLDLEQAMEQMDMCTAGLNVDIDPTADAKEEITPRSSVDHDDGDIEPDVSAADPFLEVHRPKIQQNTSLELAKAIRELEASTAALTSAYDNDSYSTTEAGPPEAAAYDTESYTSKTSLHCSSGYGTMDSTPATSEDTIPSADVTFVEDTFEPEKYMTMPRTGDFNAAYRIAVTGGQPQRPASTAGIPNSSQTRTILNPQKPPPPIRRTSSVAGTAPAHVQKMRAPLLKQISTDNSSRAAENDGTYAELQLVQQTIHKTAHHSPENPDHVQFHSGLDGVNPYMQPRGQASTASVIQSLNAKFASHNPPSDGQDGVDGIYKPPPPAVKQKPNKSLPQGAVIPPAPSVGVPPPPSVTGVPLPPSATAWHQQQYSQGGAHEAVYSTARPLPPNQAPPQGGHYSNPGPSHGGLHNNQGPLQSGHLGHQQNQFHPNSGHYSNQGDPHRGHPSNQGHPQGHPSNQGHPHRGQPSNQGPLHAGHHPYPGHHQAGHHSNHQIHQYTSLNQQQIQRLQQQSHIHHLQQQQQQQRIPAGTLEEDFPLPPTVEELQEIERIYSRPPQHGGSMPVRAQHARHPTGQPLQLQAEGVQASLLLELKRRVSVDDESSS
ncbi:unnamed protein product [Lymnaea stagnalis]|uniref:IMD domain-containing protein n=1 Tax=Lymnaea stagnalis TaxID=6523 RepID=A0AAV2IIU5_LYMST